MRAGFLHSPAARVIAATVALLGLTSAGAAQRGPTTVIEGVAVGLPKAPNGQSWDTAIGSLARLLTEGMQGLKNIQPDIQACLESEHVPGVCLPICPDADWSNEANVYVCEQTTGPYGLLLEPNLFVRVYEIDPASRRLIADFKVENPLECQPCTFESEKTLGGTLWIRIRTARVNAYRGPYRGVSGTIPRSVPTARATPPSPGGPSTPTTTSRPNRERPPAAPPTVAEIDRRLAGHDANQCDGVTYLPAGTVLGRSQLLVQGFNSDILDPFYREATFATAIEDSAVQMQVKAALLRKHETHGNEVLFQLILNDVSTGQDWDAALRELSSTFLAYLGSTLIASLGPSDEELALHQRVMKLIVEEIADEIIEIGADALVARLLGDNRLTAECALNQLAKEGFIETVGAR